MRRICMLAPASSGLCRAGVAKVVGGTPGALAIASRIAATMASKGEAGHSPDRARRRVFASKIRIAGRLEASQAARPLAPLTEASA